MIAGPFVSPCGIQSVHLWRYYAWHLACLTPDSGRGKDRSDQKGHARAGYGGKRPAAAVGRGLCSEKLTDLHLSGVR